MVFAGSVGRRAFERVGAFTGAVVNIAVRIVGEVFDGYGKAVARLYGLVVDVYAYRVFVFTEFGVGNILTEIGGCKTFCADGLI